MLEMYQVQRLCSIKKAAWSSPRAEPVLSSEDSPHTHTGSAHRLDSAGPLLN